MDLSSEQMAELRELAGSRDVPTDVALRARIVLWSGEGRRRKDIAELAGVVPVTVGYGAANNCGPDPVCTLAVTNNETGTADAQVIDAHHVLLRAERAGNGPGRIYTITIRATDAAGNTNTATVQVTVPHDSR